jgi:predicted nucleic acid-binding protein
MVIDTMVYAYALLGVTPYREPAVRAFEHDSPILVPDTLWAELANVLWQWVRHHGLEPAVAMSLMEDAEGLTSGVVASEDLWRRGLALAIEYDHPVYDTLFVTLAQREGMRVATFDQRMIERFPESVIDLDRQ